MTVLVPIGGGPEVRRPRTEGVHPRSAETLGELRPAGERALQLANHSGTDVARRLRRRARVGALETRSSRNRHRGGKPVGLLGGLDLPGSLIAWRCTPTWRSRAQRRAPETDTAGVEMKHGMVWALSVPLMGAAYAGLRHPPIQPYRATSAFLRLGIDWPRSQNTLSIALRKQPQRLVRDAVRVEDVAVGTPCESTE